MSSPLRVLWKRSDVPEPLFTADEVRRWPAGLRDSLERLGLVSRVENAQDVVCDACAEDHVEEVVYIENPKGAPTRAFILCPDSGRVEVPLWRLEQWRIDFGGLAVAVARGLELCGAVEELVPGRVWSLGTADMAGRSREVLLGRGMAWEDAGEVAGRLGSRLTGPAAVLLVAGGRPPADTWKGDGPPVVELAVLASIEGGRFVIERAHLESCLPSVVVLPRLGETPPEFMVSIDELLLAFGKSRSWFFETKKRPGFPSAVGDRYDLVAVKAWCDANDVYFGPQAIPQVKPIWEKWLATQHEKLEQEKQDEAGRQHAYGFRGDE